MKKILVAVDGSPTSLNALKMALDLGRALGAAVSLIHVTRSVIATPALPPLPGLQEAELAAGAKILKEANELAGGAALETLNLLGSPAELIADQAVEKDFDLVAVGNKGKGAVSRVLLGSVADRLTHICKRPLLVVR
jgi:nucleotide-binding universal stress UspA family protein